MKKDQMKQYPRLDTLKNPQNQVISPALSPPNVARALGTVGSGQDPAMPPGVPGGFRNKGTLGLGNKWQFGDDGGMPFRAQRMKKKSAGGDRVLKTGPPAPKLIPALGLGSGGGLERQIITTRLVTRVGKGKIRAEKKK